VITMADAKTILVIAEGEDRARELLYGAAQLGERVVFYCQDGGAINAGDVRLKAQEGVAFVEAIPALLAFA